MECVQVRRSLDTFVSGFGDADTSSEIPWISRKDKKEGRSLHEKGIFQILVYLIQVIYAVELSLFWRFICEIYNSLNSLLRPHSSVTCPSSSRDRPPYTLPLTKCVAHTMGAGIPLPRLVVAYVEPCRCRLDYASDSPRGVCYVGRQGSPRRD